MLKYEGVFKIGSYIRSYDFGPMEHRPDCYVEGRIIYINDLYAGIRGYKAYVIECIVDSTDRDDREHSRVGSEIFVPMEVSIGEYDGRITQLAELEVSNA